MRGETPLNWTRYLEKAESLANSSKQFSDGFNFDKRVPGVLPKPFSFASQGPSAATSAPASAPIAAPPAVKQEPVDEDRLLLKFKALLSEKFNEYDARQERLLEDVRSTKERMELMVKHPHNLSAPVQNRPQRGLYPVNNQQGPSRPNVCYYCNQPGHFMNDCLPREAHLQAGKIHIRADGIYTADGRRLTPNPRESMRETVDKYVAGPAQNLQSMYDDEFTRQQFSYSYASEPDSQLREEVRQLQAVIEGLKNSNSRTPLPSQTQQFVQHQKEDDSGINAVRREQEKMNRVLAQLTDTLDELKGGRAQFVNTRRTRDDEDFQDD